MSGTEGQKRMQPRMTRGTWRLAALSAGLQVAASSVLAGVRLLVSDDRWDAVLFWVYTGWFLVSLIYLLHLVLVRRNDAPFWDGEEAPRADWDRRGRRL